MSQIMAAVKTVKQRILSHCNYDAPITSQVTSRVMSLRGAKDLSLRFFFICSRAVSRAEPQPTERLEEAIAAVS